MFNFFFESHLFAEDLPIDLFFCADYTKWWHNRWERERDPNIIRPIVGLTWYGHRM